MSRTKIQTVAPGSPAHRAGVRPGETLAAINGHPIIDVLDYKFYSYDPDLVLTLREGDQERKVFLDKDVGQDLGLEFETYLMDRARSCANKCVFCFVDQMPKGMRDTLYFKDDDARLSFLMGNYITLTNLSKREIQRICDLHISPINISVHATDPEIRRELLGNKRRGGECLEIMQKFAQAGIVMNAQIVSCPGLNDGPVLQKSMEELAALYPQVKSVSIVPVGLTRYREGLYPLRPYHQDEARNVVAQVEAFGDRCVEQLGSRMFWCSDEFYLQAGLDLPADEFYEEYTQLENGVGMMRLYASEFLAELEKPHRIYGTKKMDVVTGEMASPLIRQMMAELHRQYPMVEVTVHTIKNKFFGGNVGVAGLVTATDIIAQCEGRLTSGTLGVPAVMLREEKDTFLDDITTDQLAQRLGVKVEVLPTAGGDEARALLRSGLHIARRRRA